MTAKKSPLDSLAPLYLVKQSSTAGIQLDVNEHTLEFYPRGYTKFSDRDCAPRQHTLKKLWELAVSLRKEAELYPFGAVQHNIRLVPDVANPKDRHALHVVLEAPYKGSRLQHLDGFDLGYVPLRISKPIKRNIDMINGGRILKVRANWHKKFYTVKVMIGYNEKFKTLTDIGDTIRFTDMMDEM